MSLADNRPGVHARGPDVGLSGPDPGLSLRDYALAALAFDIAPLPAKDDGTKMPMSELMVDGRGQLVLDQHGKQRWGWQHRQAVRAKPSDIERWYGSGRRTGFGIVCGAVSGKLQPLPDGLI